MQDMSTREHVSTQGTLTREHVGTWTRKHARHIGTWTRKACNLAEYELYTGSQDILKDCLYRTVRLTKNNDPDKYSYSGYGMVLIPVTSIFINIWWKNMI